MRIKGLDHDTPLMKRSARQWRNTKMEGTGTHSRSTEELDRSRIRFTQPRRKVGWDWSSSSARRYESPWVAVPVVVCSGSDETPRRRKTTLSTASTTALQSMLSVAVLECVSDSTSAISPNFEILSTSSSVPLLHNAQRIYIALLREKEKGGC